MGALLRGVCFPTVDVASAESCGQLHQSWGSGTALMTADCVASSATDLTISKCTDGSGCVSFTEPAQVYPVCAYDGAVSLSMEYFAAVLSFLVVVWRGARVYKFFWRGGYDAA
jgi:hypothetical protein